MRLEVLKQKERADLLLKESLINIGKDIAYKEILVIINNSQLESSKELVKIINNKLTNLHSNFLERIANEG